jgi:hypothetical protein
MPRESGESAARFVAAAGAGERFHPQCLALFGQASVGEPVSVFREQHEGVLEVPAGVLGLRALEQL